MTKIDEELGGPLFAIPGRRWLGFRSMGFPYFFALKGVVHRHLQQSSYSGSEKANCVFLPLSNVKLNYFFHAAVLPSCECALIVGITILKTKMKSSLF